MELLQKLPATAIPIKVLNTWKESPNVFIVRHMDMTEVIKSEESNHLKIVEIENKLRETCTLESRISHPEHNQVVAIYHPTNEKWMRGQISRVDAHFKVLLIDYFCKVVDNPVLVVPLPEWAKLIPPCTGLVVLHGILPASEVLNNNQLETQIVEDWSPMAFKSLLSYIKEELYFKFFYPFGCYENLVLGDIYFSDEISGPFLSARQILIQRNLAIYNCNQFEKGIDTQLHRFLKKEVDSQLFDKSNHPQLIGADTDNFNIHQVSQESSSPVCSTQNSGSKDLINDNSPSMAFYVHLAKQQERELLTEQQNLNQISNFAKNYKRPIRGFIRDKSTFKGKNVASAMEYEEKSGVRDVTASVSHSQALQAPCDVKVVDLASQHKAPQNRSTSRATEAGGRLQNTQERPQASNQSETRVFGNFLTHPLENFDPLSDENIVQLSVTQKESSSPFCSTQNSGSKDPKTENTVSMALIVQLAKQQERELIKEQQNLTKISDFAKEYKRPISGFVASQHKAPQNQSASRGTQAGGRLQNTQESPQARYGNAYFERVRPSSQFGLTRKWKKVQTHASRNCNQSEILVFGNFLTLPLENFYPLFDENIVQVLKQQGYNSPSQAQKYLIPYVNNGPNIVFVSNESAGKIEGIMAVVAQKLSDPHSMAKWQTSQHSSLSPIGVFVCATSEKARTVTDQLQTFLNCMSVVAGLERPASVVFMGSGDTDLRTKMSEIENGITVLVTTPNCITRLMSYEGYQKDWLCPARFLILDEVEILLKYCKVQIHQIINAHNKTNKLESRQVVALASQWTKQLRFLVRWFIKDAVLLIKPGFIALATCGVFPILTPISTFQDRLKAACTIVAKDADVKRIIVACSNDEEAETVYEAVQGLSKNNVLRATTKSTPDQLQDVFKEWKIRLTPVVVASDTVLEISGIRNANLLVHFSLPKHQQQFEKRLQYLVQQLYHPFCGMQNDMKKSPQMHVILDSEDKEKLPVFEELLKNVHGVIPKWFHEVTQDLQKIKEDRKSMCQLCPSLCQFGFCPEQKRCHFQHSLRGAYGETFDGFQQINVEILKIHNPTSFTVYVTIPSRSEKEFAYESMHENMTSYFGNFANRKVMSPEELEAGQWCAVLDHMNKYVRARLVNKVDKSSDNPKWQVSALDYGWSIQVETSQLLCLPAMFVGLKPKAINVYIANLQPPDFEPSWYPQQLDDVKKRILVDNREEQPQALGEVLFVHDDIVWVKDLVMVPKESATDSSPWSLKHWLVKRFSVIENSLILDKIKENFIALDQHIKKDEELLMIELSKGDTKSEIVSSNDGIGLEIELSKGDTKSETASSNDGTRLKEEGKEVCDSEDIQVIQSAAKPEQVTGQICQVAEEKHETTKMSYSANIEELEKFYNENTDSVNMLVDDLITNAFVKRQERKQQSKMQHCLKKCDVVESSTSLSLPDTNIIDLSPVPCGLSPVPSTSGLSPESNTGIQSLTPIPEETTEDRTSSTKSSTASSQEELDATSSESSTESEGELDSTESSTKSDATDHTETGSEADIKTEEDVTSDEDESKETKTNDIKPLIPNIEWSQNFNGIFVKILLKDLREYDVELHQQSLTFKCKKDGLCYKYERQLFAEVQPSLSHIVQYSHLKLLLKPENKSIKWLHLASEEDEPCIKRTELTFEIEDFESEWILLQNVVSCS